MGQRLELCVSIMKKDGKGHLLISYDFPEGSSMAQQCALERELTLAIARAADEDEVEYVKTILRDRGIWFAE